MPDGKKECLNNPKKILVVDDDLFTIRVLKMKLEEGGFQVLVALNGCEGLESIRKHNPDVVITDVNMPRVDGWELCSTVSQWEDRKPKILIITSLIERKDRERIKEFPNATFMDKPVSPKRLLRLLQDHFDHAKGEEENNHER
jgi:CheY-like chemotaxis protein